MLSSVRSICCQRISIEWESKASLGQNLVSATGFDFLSFNDQLELLGCICSNQLPSSSFLSLRSSALLRTKFTVMREHSKDDAKEHRLVGSVSFWQRS